MTWAVTAVSWYFSHAALFRTRVVTAVSWYFSHAALFRTWAVTAVSWYFSHAALFRPWTVTAVSWYFSHAASVHLQWPAVLCRSDVCAVSTHLHYTTNLFLMLYWLFNCTYCFKCKVIALSVSNCKPCIRNNLHLQMWLPVYFVYVCCPFSAWLSVQSIRYLTLSWW
jgi:hypothetical protein